ncbi:MAG: hypothetical protein CMJ33_10000 [Phycisphaerae bacterium]|nr:hypothetical protein [Phycisphaerae bacterium]
MNQRAKRRLALLVSITVAGTLLIIAAKALSDWNKQRRVDEAKAEGMAAFEAGDYGAALNPLSFALANDRDNVELALAFAKTRLQNTDDDGKHLFAAENLYKFTLTLDSNNEQALNALFDIYVLTNQPLNALRVAKKLPDSDVETHKKKVIAQIRIGDFEDALKSIERIREIAPEDDFWPIREYGIRRNALEQSPRDITRIFEEYTERFPGNQAAELVAIENMGRSGRKQESIRRMKEMSMREDIDPEMVMIMIPMMENLGMNREAVGLREKTMELSLTNESVAEQRIRGLWENANLQDALDESSVADENFSDSALFAKLRACIAAQNNNSNWSREEYIDPWIKKSFDIDPSMGTADKVLAEAIDMFRTNIMESGPLLRQAAALFRDDPTILQMINFMTAKSMESQGDLFGAINLYDQMQARNSTYMGGMNLAIANYRAQNFQRGIDELERVLSKKATVRGMYLYSRMLLEGDEKFIYGLASKRQNLMRLIETFIETTDESGAGAASSLLPTFTLIAMQEKDQARVQKALDWLMTVESVPLETLVEMARIKAGDETHRKNLLSMIQSRSDDQGEITMLRLEIEEDLESAREKYASAAEELEDLDQTARNYEQIHVRLLAQLARIDFEDDFRLSEFRRILGLLPENVSAARLVATYPDIWNDDPETAEIALQTIKRLTGEDSPTSTTVKVMKAITLDDIALAERAELIIQLDDVIKRSPGSIEALVLMSSLLQRGEQQDLESAANYLRRAIDLKPDLSTLYPGLIDLLRRTGNGSLALEYVNAYKNARILTLRESRTKAGVLAEEGEYRSAMDELEDIASKSGENLDILSLAQFQAVREMYEPALENFDRILESDPGNSIAILGKAMALGSIDREDEALSVIEALEDVGSGEKMRYRTLINRVSENREDELQTVQRMLQLDPDDVLNIMVAAETYQRMGMIEERREALKRAVDLQPGNLDILIIMARDMVSNQPGSPGLEGILDEIEKARPNTARVLRLVRDSTDGATGQLNPTEDQIIESAEIADVLVNMYEAQRVAWLIHTSANLSEAAYKIAFRAFINHPTRMEPLYWATRSALQSGMYQEAVDISEIGMNRVSQKEKLAYTLEFSNLCMQLGFESRALSLLRPLQDIAADEERLTDLISRSTGDNITPLLIRVTLLRAMLGSYKAREAAELFGPLMSQDEELLSSWIRAAKQLDVDDCRNALRIIKPYLESPRQLIDNAEALSELARISGESEDVDALLEYVLMIDDVIAEYETDASLRCRALILKSSLMSLEGKTLEAIRALEEVTDLVRGQSAMSEELGRINCVALNNMALHQCELNPPDTDGALANIEIALLEAPEAILPSLHETRSTIYKVKGDCELSIKSLEKAIELSEMVKQIVQFRVTLAELLYECGYTERSMSESRVLQEYIYGSPQPDMNNLNRLEVLIEKGVLDEE